MALSSLEWSAPATGAEAAGGGVSLIAPSRYPGAPAGHPGDEVVTGPGSGDGFVQAVEPLELVDGGVGGRAPVGR